MRILRPEFILDQINLEAAKILWQLSRICFGLACGLLLANLLEAMRWTEGLAKLAIPLARVAHLGPEAASAFTLAFVSPYAANALLSQKHAAGVLSSRELLFANLFNGLPAWLAHIPSVFFLLWPVLGLAALSYAGITFIAALARTLATVLFGRLLLHAPPAGLDIVPSPAAGKFGERLGQGFAKAFARLKKRLPRLLIMTTVAYALMWIAQKSGCFQAIEIWLVAHLDWLSILKPEAIGIIVLQLLAETGATLGAAGAAIQDASLTAKDVVLALLIGNVLATPLRAIRHQFPAYAGFFGPGLALKLIIANQSVRAASLIAAIAFYASL